MMSPDDHDRVFPVASYDDVYGQPEPVDVSDDATSGNATPRKRPPRPRDRERHLDATGVVADGKRLTDAGNADRLVQLHGDELRYVRTWGRWLAWNGRAWVLDPNQTLAGRLARSVAKHVLGLIAEESDDATRKMLLAAGRYAESAKGIRNMLDVARSDVAVTIHHDDLDTHPRLITLANGTLDLDTGRLHAHDPDDLMTLESPVVFDPRATAPMFESFLERVLPDEDVRLYVQSRLGACLSGDVRDHELHVHYGTGANGKTTLFSIVAHALGDYAVVAPKSLLIFTHHEAHPTDRTVLFRRRLAYAGEIPDGARLHESLVKELTGGDPITARRMREDFWTFQPNHKLHLFANHLPHVVGTDHGIWRRLRVVPFDVRIPDGEQDKDLARRIIATELPGVLNWLLDGYHAWISDRVTIPAAVRQATSDYRHAEDTVARFLDEELVFDAASSITASNMVTAHRRWCEAMGFGDHDISAHYRRVTPELEHNGAKRVQRQHVKLWSGVRLIDRGTDGAGPSQ